MSIKIENTQVFGWEAAIRGARNPMNSWEKSDSHSSINYPMINLRAIDDECDGDYDFDEGPRKVGNPNEELDWYKLSEELRLYFEKLSTNNSDSICYSGICLGPTDHKLLMNLCKGGTEEAKWRRMIHVQMDITAPLYWWKEFETYKVGTVSNSCSTMHKIQAKEFTLDDFSCEHLFREPDDIPNFIGPNRFDDEINWHYNNGAYNAYKSGNEYEDWVEAKYAFDNALSATIYALNYYREKFLETNDKEYWWQMIQLLPSSYNQRRTIDLNYEVLASQYRQRKDHKLDEWHQYSDWICSLPYSEFITMEE